MTGLGSNPLSVINDYRCGSRKDLYLFMVLNEDSSVFVLNPNINKEKTTRELNEDLIIRIEELTKLRKSISLDLKQIASTTKISTHQLKNIEGLKFEKLPPHPMRESFIEQYCQVIQKKLKNQPKSA